MYAPCKRSDKNEWGPSRVQKAFRYSEGARVNSGWYIESRNSKKKCPRTWTNMPCSVLCWKCSRIWSNLVLQLYSSFPLMKDVGGLTPSPSCSVAKGSQTFKECNWIETCKSVRRVFMLYLSRFWLCLLHAISIRVT